MQSLLRCGAPDTIRTCGLQSRSLTLYPTELRTHMKLPNNYNRVLTNCKGLRRAVDDLKGLFWPCVSSKFPQFYSVFGHICLFLSIIKGEEWRFAPIAWRNIANNTD